MSLNPYSGYHAFTWTSTACDAPASCCTSDVRTDSPETTYWACAACCRNNALGALATTLSHYDDARAVQAARFKVPMASMTVPEHTQLIMMRFRELGGVVTCKRI